MPDLTDRVNVTERHDTYSRSKRIAPAKAKKKLVRYIYDIHVGVYTLYIRMSKSTLFMFLYRIYLTPLYITIHAHALYLSL